MQFPAGCRCGPSASEHSAPSRSPCCPRALLPLPLSHARACAHTHTYTHGHTRVTDGRRARRACAGARGGWRASPRHPAPRRSLPLAWELAARLRARPPRTPGRDLGSHELSRPQWSAFQHRGQRPIRAALPLTSAATAAEWMPTGRYSKPASAAVQKPNC